MIIVYFYIFLLLKSYLYKHYNIKKILTLWN